MPLVKDANGVVVIEGAVGHGCPNRAADVVAIQQLLNEAGETPPLAVDGLCGTATIAAIEAYQADKIGMSVPDGRVDVGGRTLRALSGAERVTGSNPGVAPVVAASGGRLYTQSPNERATTRTTPTAKQVVDLLLASWPELVEEGARTLTAQFMVETGRGRFCFNWNLGNVKASEDQPHMFLAHVWECMNAGAASSAIAAGGGLARLASAAEIAAHGWVCSNTVVVFDPPHPQSRFRAYATLQEGATLWVGRHKSYAASVSDYLDAINAGDVERVAAVLKSKGYFSAPLSSYTSQMQQMKNEVDATLGSD